MSNLFEHCRVGVSSAKPRRRIYSLQHYGAMGRRAGRSLRPRGPAAVGMLRRLRPADTVQPIFASEFFPKNRFLLSCIFFFCAFVLIQKHQKIKHGEKERVPPPALAERAQKTPLFCTPVPGARAGVVTASAIFATRSRRPEACQNTISKDSLFGCGRRAAASVRRRH